ncbi:MAG: glycosyltransferase [Deltaproteobacteria bacterium]|nr:glycosyltransferase [Deltaproteobacteria bacterium]
MQPVNVLHAVEDLKIGGMERVIASIVTGLDPVKYAAHVLCLTRGGTVADELIRQGVPVTILGLDNYHRPGQLLALCRWLRGNNCHILHTHGYFAGVFARIAGLWVGVPHIITHVHSAYVDYQSKNRCMEKVLSFWTDRVICVSRTVQEWVVEAERIDRGKTCVIYNGAGLNFPDRPNGFVSTALRRTLGIPDSDTVFTVVASLTSNKGHHVLLEAFKSVLAAHPDATLLVVGDGPRRTEIETRARQLAIDRKAIFTGLRTDIDALLGISDVCLLPSQFREGLGLALIEAMATGLPVIGTRIGGIPEVIQDGENGFLVPPGNPGALADAMIRIAKDRDLKIRMGRRGRQIYEEKFSLSEMIRQIETLYALLPEDQNHALTY